VEITRALPARFPGARTRVNAYGGVTLVFEHGGAWLEARIREGIDLEVFVRTLDVPGLELTIECDGRHERLPSHVRGGSIVGADDHEIARALDLLGASRCVNDLRVRRSDDPIADLWIDVPAERALLDAVWVTRTQRAVGEVVQLESFRYQVGDGQVMFSRRGYDLDQVHRAFLAAATVATRPHRIATAWLDAARGLGGTTTTERWDLADRGGEFAVTFDRNPAEVRVDCVRRHPGDDDEHRGLYTRARARRLAAHGDRWALWQRDLPRAHRPNPGRGLHPVAHLTLDALAADPARLLARLRPHEALLAAAAPSSIATVDDAIELWWPGLVDDPARLGPAVELLSKLAGEVDASAGPYR